MSETTGGAGPALAAHSKDASAPGQSPASEAIARPAGLNSGEAGETIMRIADEMQAFLRQQPLLAMAVCGGIGVLIGLALRHR